MAGLLLLDAPGINALILRHLAKHVRSALTLYAADPANYNLFKFCDCKIGGRMVKRTSGKQSHDHVMIIHHASYFCKADSSAMRGPSLMIEEAGRSL
jgi:hypothetical protein